MAYGFTTTNSTELICVRSVLVRSTILPTEMSTYIENQSQVNTKFDSWSSIRQSKMPTSPAYVHPIIPATYPFRSTRVLNQRSLDMCTESLGSESGSDGYFDIDHCFHDAAAVILPRKVLNGIDRYHDKVNKELSQVNYHCSIVCINMKPHRRDGKLIIEAVSVPSQNYLHCRRQNGRLLLSFVNTTFEDIYPEFQKLHDPASAGQRQTFPDFINYEPEEEDEEVEDQVEVVDRGILVEVKVISRQGQFQSRGTKIRKSSLVINKFVSGIPLVPINLNLMNLNVAADGWRWAQDEAEEESNGKQLENNNSSSNKFLFTTKKLINRQALLHQVRSCSYHHRPLFIWERCCIATS
ncbi:hypothetical protein ZOSMA_186G00060 [Zostera marina]|uniref:FAF domain-containing protein n=1 Tax=Zostera marina TaxID=29655 RepID=A0A0K9PQC1_ZOSMR|nr:hypothetical protein ZOSMA_186G00060 [Zostera marina]